MAIKTLEREGERVHHLSNKSHEQAGQPELAGSGPGL